MINREPKSIDITANPELLRLVREMESADQPLSLREEDREVAVLLPSKPAKRSRRKTGILTKDDPLTQLIGIGHSGVGDIAENKHQYLANDYLVRHKNL